MKQVLGEFEVVAWPLDSKLKYTYVVKNLNLKERGEFSLKHKHLDELADDDVVAAFILESNLTSIPRHLMERLFTYYFVNIVSLSVKKCNLKRICKEDLKDLSQLHELYFPDNNLEYLPGNLLTGMKELKYVSFKNNNIKFIEPELIDDLKKLTQANFIGNLNINLKYDKKSEKTFSFKSFSDVILDKCKVSDEAKLQWQNESEMKKSKSELIAEKNSLQDQLNSKNKDGFQHDIKLASLNENFKDFTISLEDKEFKVHKFVLMARSSVLAEMILNNPSASVLKLLDIPLTVFEQILKFIYNDILPLDGADFKDIFIASGRLKLNKLHNHAGLKLLSQITDDNAYEVLVLANKYEHETLKMKAFEVMKRQLPDIELKDQLANQPDKIKLLIDAKRLKEEAVKKAEEEFQKLLKQF